MTRTARTAAALATAAAFALSATPALAGDAASDLLPIDQTTTSAKIVAKQRGSFPKAPTVKLTAEQKRDRVPDAFKRLGKKRSTPVGRASINGTTGPFATKLNSIVGYVDSFWRARIRGYRSPVIYNDMRRYGTIRCGGYTLSLNNAWYCPAAHFVTWDSQFLLRYFNSVNHGDMGVAAIIAHEWGHASQALLGLRSAKMNYSIWRELYADCQAGAWSADMARNRRLDNIGVGDAREAVNTIWSLGDAAGTHWTHSSAHGTSQQRYNFFVYGWNYGPQACVNQVL